jgi:hypothetical protein
MRHGNRLTFQAACFEILILGILILSLCVAAAGGVQAPAWKGRVETVDGVKVVRNPASPLYGEFVPQLEEDLSLGNPSDETYYFPKGAGLNVDDEGNLYVCDFGNKRVQKYDKNGKYVRTIGRQGQGPGEYMYPSQVFFDENGNPCVKGWTDLNFFTKDGAFKKRVNIKQSLTYFVLGPGGKIIGMTQPNPRLPSPSYELLMLNAEGEVERQVAGFPATANINKEVLIWHAYSPNLFFTSVTSDKFAYGFSSEYKIYLADREGRTLFAIVDEEKPQSISGREKDVARKKGPSAWAGNPGNAEPRDLMLFPDHRPFFGSLLSDGEGRLFVLRSKPILDETSDATFGIFSKEGIYTYRMKLDFRPFLIKRGAIYEIREDKETGDFKIIRYRVKNWEALSRPATPA